MTGGKVETGPPDEVEEELLEDDELEEDELEDDELEDDELEDDELDEVLDDEPDETAVPPQEVNAISRAASKARFQVMGWSRFYPIFIGTLLVDPSTRTAFMKVLQ